MNVSQPQERMVARDGHVATPSTLTMLTAPASQAAEAYRSLRASVKFADVEPRVQSVLIVDTTNGNQHTAIAANLAAALALGGDTVMLIDANLRSPKLHEYVGGRNDSGLADWLAAENHDGFVPIQTTAVEGLRLLSAGSAAKLGRAGSTPADHLGGQMFVGLVERLRNEASFLVFDAPSLSEVGDALAIAAQADAVLLLVRSGKTKREAAQRAKESLDRIGAHVLGAVLTDAGGRLRIRR